MAAGEKSEAPTPRKREEERKRGNIPKSTELNSVAVLLAGALALKYFGGGMLYEVLDLMDRSFRSVAVSDWTVAGVASYGSSLNITFLRLMAPLMALLCTAGVAVSFVQGGGLLTTKPLAPDPSRINPFKGMKRIVSKRSLVELAKSLAKFGLVGYVTFQSFEGRYLQIITLSGTDLRGAAAQIGDAMLEILLRAGFALLALAALDYGYQRWQYERNIRMTRQELKEEMRQSEGDPQVRAKIRRQQRQMASRRMMQAVPNSDVVITNPTHFAVALRYKPESMRAPEVTAKGLDLVAGRIKQIARENDVPVVENKPLAQDLYKAVEIGHEIPPTLYHAVAEVLAFIFSLKRSRRLS